uniref:CBS domain-containing protein n=1 Tax=Araucaria cunninghamii TaxID=56994 RepID=A0A0D6R683_ARACU
MSVALLNEKAIMPDRDYYEIVQARKRLPNGLQEALNNAFAKIPVSFFPEVPGGKVIEIPADTSIADAVQILSEHNILSAPVRNPEADDNTVWYDRYLGMLDYSAIIFWVLENAELAAVALAAGSATAAGMGVGAVGALGAIALGTTGPAAVAGLTIAAFGAAVAGGLVVDKHVGKDAPAAADYLGEDFYKVILQEEPFKSTTIQTLLRSFRWTPFLPVQPNDSMLTVMLLLSKYRLRSVPIIEMDKPSVENMITQSAVVKGLLQCRGRDWFDAIATKPISELGLPFMSPNKVICIDGKEPVLEAFKRMNEKQIGGLPVVQGPTNKIIGNISMRDIRFLLLHQELFSRFRQLTAVDFMRTVASTTGSSVMMPPITCTYGTSLGDVIEILSTKCIHRVHLVDEQDVVLGVITLRDVISCFVSEPERYFENYFGFFSSESR